VAFRARLFNIGAEGQLYLGALAAVAVGGLHGGSGFSAPDLDPAALDAAGGRAGRRAAAAGAGAAEEPLRVDEVVTTLLLNFIVLLGGVGAMLDGPMKDPAAMGWPQSVALQDGLQLSQAGAGTQPGAHRLAGALGWRCAVGAADSPRTASRSAPSAPTRAAAFAGMPVAWAR
jgi:ABC-type uncharacterized transport system permease subunit